MVARRTKARFYKLEFLRRGIEYFCAALFVATGYQDRPVVKKRRCMAGAGAVE